MLRYYYSLLLGLTGDLSAGSMGPYADKSDNDIGLLQDFATSTVGGTSQPKRIWFQGSNFVQGQSIAGIGHPGFTASFFGAGFASSSYRDYAANTTDIVDLETFAPVHASGGKYSVLNSCISTVDVLSLGGALGSAVPAVAAK